MSTTSFQRLTLIFAMLGLLALPAAGNAVTIINPDDITGLRSFNSGVNVLLLTFSPVKLAPLLKIGRSFTSTSAGCPGRCR